jgi:hypothetical protein
MRQVQVRKTSHRPTDDDLDTRTPSGKPLPF